MKRRNGRNGLKKERVVMVASTVLILSALTVTGAYVRKGDKTDQDGGYTIDLKNLEEENSKQDENTETAKSDDDLDYDPGMTEVDSNKVKNTYGKTNKIETALEMTEADLEKDLPKISEKKKANKSESKEPKEPQAEEVAEIDAEVDAELALAQVPMPELTFNEDSRLMMPFVGNVVLNYSPDKSIYFPTLKQYKCNPAIMISANRGTDVKAAADGVIGRIVDDPVTGKTVVMNLGNGYEITYGQLMEVTKTEGSFVKEGESFAAVEDPTRYFEEEGTHLYIKLTKDGKPVNPVG